MRNKSIDIAQCEKLSSQLNDEYVQLTVINRSHLPYANSDQPEGS